MVRSVGEEIRPRKGMGGGRVAISSGLDPRWLGSRRFRAVGLIGDNDVCPTGDDNADRDGDGLGDWMEVKGWRGGGGRGVKIRCLYL